MAKEYSISESVHIHVEFLFGASQPQILSLLLLIL